MQTDILEGSTVPVCYMEIVLLAQRWFSLPIWHFSHWTGRSKGVASRGQCKWKITAANCCRKRSPAVWVRLNSLTLFMAQISIASAASIKSIRVYLGSRLPLVTHFQASFREVMEIGLRAGNWSPPSSLKIDMSASRPPWRPSMLSMAKAFNYSWWWKPTTFGHCRSNTPELTVAQVNAQCIEVWFHHWHFSQFYWIIIQLPYFTRS